MLPKPPGHRREPRIRMREDVQCDGMLEALQRTKVHVHRLRYALGVVHNLVLLLDKLTAKLNRRLQMSCDRA